MSFLSEKGDAATVFARETSETYRCQFIVHIPASARRRAPRNFLIHETFALTFQLEKHTPVPHFHRQKARYMYFEHMR